MCFNYLFMKIKYVESKTQSQLLYLTNKGIAMVSSFPEIMDSLNKIFGGENRCFNFYLVKLN